MNTKSPDQRGQRGRYRVVVVRSTRRTVQTPTTRRTEERIHATYVLGPFRLRATALLVAWLETFSTTQWVQRCKVESIGPERVKARYMVRVVDIERFPADSASGTAIEERVTAVTEMGPYRFRFSAWLGSLLESGQDDYLTHRCEVIRLDANQTQKSDGA